MKQEKAYYHLPGLFEFYELYREFLPLFRAHREYFYDWCDIGSIYGAPATASGAGDGLASGSMTQRGPCPDAGIRHLRAADLQQLAPPGGTPFG